MSHNAERTAGQVSGYNLVKADDEFGERAEAMEADEETLLENDPIPEGDRSPGSPTHTSWLRVSRRAKGCLLVLASAFTFSVMTLAVNVLSSEIASFELAAIRCFLLVLINAMVLVCRRVPLRRWWCGNSRRELLWLCLRGSLGWLGVGFGFMAISLLPLGDATVIIFTAPIWSALGGWLILGERVGLKELGAALIGFIGVMFVVRPEFIFGDASGGDHPVGGVVAGFVASIGAGLVFVVVRKLQVEYRSDTNVIIHFFGIVGTVFSLAGMLIFRQVLSIPSGGKEWGLVLLVGVTGTLGQQLLTMGLKLEKAAIASSMRMGDVFFAFIWQVLFLEGSVSPLSIVGALLVCASVLIILLLRSRKGDANGKDKPDTEPVDSALELTNVDSGRSENGGRDMTHIIERIDKEEKPAPWFVPSTLGRDRLAALYREL